MNFFSLEYINTLKKSGTILPSSKYLIAKCLKGLELNKAKVVVEFGMGDGCITREILNRTGDETLLFSFEINPRFCMHCKHKFEGNTSLKIVNESAFNFKSVLQDNAIAKVDYVISSLPMSLFSKKDTLALLESVKKYLMVDGYFIQYQYSLGNEKLINNTFDTVSRQFTFLNLPPAFVFKCS